MRREHRTWYDPAVLDALTATLEIDVRYAPRVLSPRDLKPGMIIAADVVSSRGTLLVAKGLEVTPTLRIRLMNIADNSSLAGGIQVFVPLTA